MPLPSESRGRWGVGGGGSEVFEEDLDLVPNFWRLEPVSILEKVGIVGFHEKL